MIAGSPERGGRWPRMEGFPFLQSRINNPSRRVLKFTTLLCKAKENASDASTSGWWCSRITQTSTFDRAKPKISSYTLLWWEENPTKLGKMFLLLGCVCVRVLFLNTPHPTPKLLYPLTPNAKSLAEAASYVMCCGKSY